MKLFKVYPAIGEDHICTTYAESPEEAMELVKSITWLAAQMTETAYAERVEEL